MNECDFAQHQAPDPRRIEAARRRLAPADGREPLDLEFVCLALGGLDRQRLWSCVRNGQLGPPFQCEGKKVFSAWQVTKAIRQGAVL